MARKEGRKEERYSLDKKPRLRISASLIGPRQVVPRAPRWTRIPSVLFFFFFLTYRNSKGERKKA